MSINKSEYKHALNGIVNVMKVLAGDHDMASVQINSSGVCILREGVQYSEHLSVDEFAARMDEIMEEHWNAE